MPRQQIVVLTLGCEDVNDHDELRQDSMLSLATGEAGAGVDWRTRALNISE